MSKIEYRPEIDGLRAIAVLSVFLFHANHQFLPGGFIGVDIFFVLSGFLISSILIAELKLTGSIDFLDFYRRRVRRLIPALTAVLIASIIVGLFILLPADLVHLARSVPPAFFFLSNFHFMKTKDYFAPDSSEFPLLHTWSLSIEEQFYLIWPFILIALLKLNLRQVFLSLIIVCFSFLTFAQFQQSGLLSKEVAYFNPLSRFSELLIGCMTALAMYYAPREVDSKAKRGLAWISILVLLASFILIDQSSVFPGYLALLPCLATSGLLWAMKNEGGSYLNVLFSSSILRFFGLHSYALYLWHWPVLAFYRYLTGKEGLFWGETGVIFCISLFLSLLSRRFIEVPLGKTNLSARRVFLYFFIVPGALLLTAAGFLNFTEGLPSRIGDPSQLRSESTFLSSEYCHETSREDCFFLNSKGKERAVLFGDSHAGHYAPVWREILRDSQIDLYAKSADSCPPILEPRGSLLSEIEKNSPRFCLTGLSTIREKIADAEIVILAGYWSAYFESSEDFESQFIETVETLLMQEKIIIIAGQIPMFTKGDFKLLSRMHRSPIYQIFPGLMGFENEELDIAEVPEPERIPQILERHFRSSDRIFYLDVSKRAQAFFGNSPFVGKKLVYKDFNHLNLNGAELLGQAMKETVRQDLCRLLNCKSLHNRH